MFKIDCEILELALSPNYPMKCLMTYALQNFLTNQLNYDIFVEVADFYVDISIQHVSLIDV